MLGRRKCSPLKNAYIDDFDLLCVLHLSSDFDVQTQADEFIQSFSTFWIIVRTQTTSTCKRISLLKKSADEFIYR